jgi:hypothetical protein
MIAAIAAAAGSRLIRMLRTRGGMRRTQCHEFEAVRNDRTEHAHRHSEDKHRRVQQSRQSHRAALPDLPGPTTEVALHRFLAVCIGSNLCKARAAYVNVGFGAIGEGSWRIGRGRNETGRTPMWDAAGFAYRMRDRA